MGTGSTILARQSGSIYFPIVLALILCGIALIVFFIVKQIQASHQTPEYLEHEKQRPTKPADIKRTRIKYNLSAKEAALLWNICSYTQAPNIFFLLHDDDKIQEIFRTYYLHITEAGADTPSLIAFFELRYKMECALALTSKISDTTLFPDGASVFYINDHGELFPSTIVTNSKNFLQLEISKSLYENENIRPEPLKRAKFMFKSPSGMTYLFASRPVRYAIENERCCMFISHSSNLFTQTKRTSKRLSVKTDCTFSAVKQISSKGKDMYTPSENQYKGLMINISGGGCCIHSSLPVVEKQKIIVYCPEVGLDEKTVGIIRHTRKVESSGKYAMHIQFENMNPEVLVKIYSFVYKFELQEQI